MSWHKHDVAMSHYVPSSDEPGLRLHVRQRGTVGHPVLFVHGATYASRLFDIPHPGASWLQATARAGFAAYALDIRGYGRSRSRVMEVGNGPYARATDAVRDIEDVARWVCARHGVKQLGMVGGSWGSITAALYACGPGRERVERLALYAPIFGEYNYAWLQILADPAYPKRLAAWERFRLVDEATTRARWDAEIPSGEDWRSEEVLQALVQSSLADDPTSIQRDPPSFRVPNGTFFDLWEAFNGRPLYDPVHLVCPLLLIRGGADPTSTRSDALALLDRAGATTKSYIEIANGAHFVSAESRAPHVFAAVGAFLSS